MRVLQTFQLPRLLRTQPYPCISIYLGFGETPEERRKTQDHLKSLIDLASATLEQSPAAHLAPLLLSPLRKNAWALTGLMSDDVKGVAIFRSLRTSAVYPVEYPINDYVAVADTFHLKPLLPELQGHDSYFVVTLNHRAIRLYDGNEQRVRLLDSLDPAQLGCERSLINGYCATDGQRVLNVVPPVNVSLIPSILSVEEFVGRAQAAIEQRLKRTNAPIVLAGSALMKRLYRTANKSDQVLDESIGATLGIHETRSIHKASWPIARREFYRRFEHVSTAYRKMKDLSKASDTLEEIVKEGVSGRVSHVLVSREDFVFGRIDRQRGKVIRLSPTASPLGDDVLCDIAQEVLLHGGSAFLVPKNQMPTNEPAAALFRW